MSQGEIDIRGSLPPDSSARRATWIISPAADLTLLIATPLAIVPLILHVAWRNFSVEQISLMVVAFASIGHQLPGFLRAYSDPTLFARYRWRMLLAPPLVLAAAWLIARTQLHGLVLILLLWSTWHVLMQTYGILRIYDLKHGWATKRRARIDFWSCVALFAWGFAGSDARLFLLTDTAWRIGLPMLTPLGADLLRWSLTAGALVMLGIYLLSCLLDYRAGQFVWVKPILLLSTGWLYWLCGTAAIPVLLGVAMFEVFHAIQYDTLVWAYDRKLGATWGRRLGSLSGLFERRGSFMVIYILAIGIFGALSLLPSLISEPQVQAWLLAAITASTLLHFYYDGFIWKISAEQRQQSPEINRAQVPSSIPHWLKCAGLALLVGGLLLLESRVAPQPSAETTWLLHAAHWAPNLPEVQLRLCRAQVVQGDIPAALVTARRAVNLVPNSAAAQADLGALYLRAERYAEAEAALTAANQLEPTHWQYQFDLGLAQTQTANWTGAAHSFAAADQESPRNSRIQRGWADMELARGDAAAAADRLRDLITAYASEPMQDAKTKAELSRHLIKALSAAIRHEQAIDTARQLTQTDGSSSEAWLALGRAHYAAGQYEQAIPPLNTALELHSQNAEARFQLGMSQLQLGNITAGRKQFRLAVENDPRYSLAWFQLANIAYGAGELSAAVDDYRQCLAVKPKWAEAHSNLGAVLFAQRDWPAAAAAYRLALELAPHNAQAHYNLGLLLLLQNDLPGARQHIGRAAALGQPCSAEVAEQLGLNQ